MIRGLNRCNAIPSPDNVGLLPAGGPLPDRPVEDAVKPFDREPGIQAASLGDDRPTGRVVLLRCDPPISQLGRQTVHGLRFEPDQLPGVGQ